MCYLDNLRITDEVEWQNPCPTPCTTPPTDPMPTPTGLVLPDSIYFGEPFELHWDDVWTGCGGYEISFDYQGAFETFDVASGSATTITIPRPGCETVSECVILLRSYWGGTCDDRVYSEPWVAFVRIHAREDVPLIEFSVGDGDTMAIAPGDTIGPIEVSTEDPQNFCWTVIPGCIGSRNIYGYRYGWDDGWEVDWTPFVADLGKCGTIPLFSGGKVLTIGIVTSVGEFYYSVELVFP